MKKKLFDAKNSERVKIGYVLIAVLLLSLTYPLSEEGLIPALIFIFLYLGLLGSGIYLVSSNRTLFLTSIALTIIIGATGVMTVASNFTAPIWVQLTWGLALLVYQSLIITMLVMYIIQSNTVTVEVLYAAVTIYFMLAASFALVYGMMETTSPGAFVSSSGAEITWQRMTYFSFVTITTLGYGDIVPVGPTAQALSALEASVGTLYIAILIGRFVSLFPTESQQSMS